jgi:hypothetical protein
MALPTKKENLEPQAQAMPAEIDEKKTKSWWSAHASILFVVGTLILVVLLLVFNMN